MKHNSLTPTIFKERTNQWQEHDFYRSAVVLGLDIGLEGIGIFLRRGLKEVYAKTLDLEGVIREAEALAGRRQKRAWRHCRKNQATCSVLDQSNWGSPCSMLPSPNPLRPTSRKSAKS